MVVVVPTIVPVLPDVDDELPLDVVVTMRGTESLNVTVIVLTVVPVFPDVDPEPPELDDEPPLVGTFTVPRGICTGAIVVLGIVPALPSADPDRTNGLIAVVPPAPDCARPVPKVPRLPAVPERAAIPRPWAAPVLPIPIVPKPATPALPTPAAPKPAEPALPIPAPPSPPKPPEIA